jgi:hypothetical protein
VAEFGARSFNFVTEPIPHHHLRGPDPSHRARPGVSGRGETPHAVGAISEHVIIAVGAPHKPIDAHDRMTEVPYTEVIADDGQLACLICDLAAHGSRRLHLTGCPHCPCAVCVG